MDTTLEEVFLKVSEEDQSLENSEAGERSQSCSSVLPLSTPHPLPAASTWAEAAHSAPVLGLRALGGSKGPQLPARLTLGLGAWAGRWPWDLGLPRAKWG